jgi:hypothetical protein
MDDAPRWGEVKVVHRGVRIVPVVEAGGVTTGRAVRMMRA